MFEPEVFQLMNYLDLPLPSKPSRFWWVHFKSYDCHLLINEAKRKAA